VETNLGPLSDCKEVGIPKWGIMSHIRMEATVEALLLVVGKASTHPEKLFTRTKKYLNFLTGGMWVKSICQSEAGRTPQA
jgi:hypothetical protein